MPFSVSESFADGLIAISEMTSKNCFFCETEGGHLLWRDDTLRIVSPTSDDAIDYPGFCRVIWHAHVAEFSALSKVQRIHLMEVIASVERVILHIMQATKVNLASLGNQVPHLHWHVIPRYADDAHFPMPIWAPRIRQVDQALLGARQASAQKLRDAIIDELQHRLQHH